MTTSIVEKLQTWRDANHDKTITLTRSEVVVLLEMILVQPRNDDTYMHRSDAILAALSDDPEKHQRDDGTHVHRLDEREGDQ